MACQAAGRSYAPINRAATLNRVLGAAIPAADRALESGALEPVEELLTHAVKEGLHGRFEAARSKRPFATHDVAAGREYVAAYVEYIHAGMTA